MIDENLENLGNNAKLRDLGIEWSDRLVKAFMEDVGKSYKAEERALFYMTFGGDLFARMFVDVRKEITERHGAEAGEQVAKKLLEAGFSFISMLLRRHGEETQAGVRVTWTEVANFQAKGKAAEPACDHAELEAQMKVCNCNLDQDGRCAECAKTFKDMFSLMSQAVQLMKSGNMLQAKICYPCMPRHMDAALAQVVKEDVAKLPPAGAEAVMSALFMSSQSLQAMPMPLSKKAWSEIQS